MDFVVGGFQSFTAAAAADDDGDYEEWRWT